MANSQAAGQHRSHGSVLGGVAAAAALNTVPAWLTWLALESPIEGTLLRSDLDARLTVVTAALIATVLGAFVALRSSKRSWTAAKCRFSGIRAIGSPCHDWLRDSEVDLAGS